jgi:hypothetical protein
MVLCLGKKQKYTFVAIVSGIGGIGHDRLPDGRFLCAVVNRPAVGIALANSLPRFGGCQMTGRLTVRKNARKVSRRACAPHEAELLSKRLAVLDRMLSALRTEPQSTGRTKGLRLGLARVSSSVRRPIAAR